MTFRHIFVRFRFVFNPKFEKMKKLITAVALVATMFVAEKVQAQFSVNFGLSHNFITERVSTGGTPTGDAPSISINSLYSEGYSGLSLGANYNFRLSEEFGISVGGQFRWNHLHLSKSILGPMPIRYISNVFYVDVPVMLNYSCKISDNWKVGPFIGPMLTYGLGGTIKICNKYHSNAKVHPWYGDYGDSHFSKHDYKRLDLSAVAGVAFSYKRLNLYGSYRYGLLDIDKDAVAKTHTSGISLGVGFAF